jgi:hypothetical protein
LLPNTNRTAYFSVTTAPKQSIEFASISQ